MPGSPVVRSGDREHLAVADHTQQPSPGDEQVIAEEAVHRAPPALCDGEEEVVEGEF